MKTLERKAPHDIAEELVKEVREVGADFGEMITAKLKKYGYDNPYDVEIREKIISAFYERR